jgi:hypothetical protein
MSSGDFDPTLAVPTEDLSRRCLEMLRAGELGREFIHTSHHLSLSTAEPIAVIEGTLLFVGADLEKIAQAGCDPEKDPAVEHLRKDRRIFAYLEFVEGFFEAENAGKLRPVGREILDHCLLLSNDTEITAALRRIQDGDGIT